MACKVPLSPGSAQISPISETYHVQPRDQASLRKSSQLTFCQTDRQTPSVTGIKDDQKEENPIKIL